MTQPLREDFPIYDLPSEKVIDGPWPPAQTPAAVLANPDALQAPAKKAPGRPKGSKNAKRKTKKAKSKSAVVPSAAEGAPGATTLPAVGSHAPGDTARNIAPSGEGIWDRIRRIKGDTWLMIAACVAAVLALAAFAFLIFGR